MGARQGSGQLLKLLEQSDADVIALQEVSPWFCEQLSKQDWFKKYHGTMKNGKLIAVGGLLIISKNKIVAVAAARLNAGRQGRALLTIDTHIGKIPVTVATCHLESFLQAGPTRALQIKQFMLSLAGKKHVVFMGDFNFGDGEAEVSAIEKSYVDAWTQLHKKLPGLTWNMELSQMAKLGAFKTEKSRRLDRIFIKSPSLKPIQIKIIGNQPIPGSKTIFPSDHFGLECVVE